MQSGHGNCTHTYVITRMCGRGRRVDELFTKIRSVKLSSEALVAFSQKFAPAKISCYTVTLLWSVLYVHHFSPPPLYTKRIYLLFLLILFRVIIIAYEMNILNGIGSFTVYDYYKVQMLIKLHVYDK